MDNIPKWDHAVFAETWVLFLLNALWEINDA